MRGEEDKKARGSETQRPGVDLVAPGGPDRPDQGICTGGNGVLCPLFSRFAPVKGSVGQKKTRGIPRVGDWTYSLKLSAYLSGEKSVGVRKIETGGLIFRMAPAASEASRTLIHSGSARKSVKDFLAASTELWARK